MTEQTPKRFDGTDNYIATDDLKVAVDAAVTLRRPLLVKGEPGTGKTVLAHEIASAVDAPLIEWNVKSTTKAQQGLYEYDAVARLRDGQLGEERVHDIRNYIKKGKLWEAFTSEKLPVLLIDEIDKADIEFPNDLLQELDRMSFDVYETQERITAKERPIVVITSNNEKELPRRLSASLLLPLHQIPGSRHDALDHRGALSWHSKEPRHKGLWMSFMRFATFPALRKSPQPASYWTGLNCSSTRICPWKCCRIRIHRRQSRLFTGPCSRTSRM